MRQKSLLGAAWTVGALGRFAAAGADLVNCYDAAGPFGVMDAATVYPLFHVLADVGEFAGAGVLELQSGGQPRIAALGLVSGPRARLILANLTDRDRTVEVAGLDEWPSVRIRRLNESVVERATRLPLEYRNDAPEPGHWCRGAVSLSLSPWETATLTLEGGPA
jgi:hypothetical protein